MKKLGYLFVGIYFGFLLIKGEAISWYRMQEMFRFESFHMFGIFFTAIPVGVISLWLIRKTKIKTFSGEPIAMPIKKFSLGNIFGGLIFGFGWALTGACPGPLYVLIGAGYAIAVIMLIAALAGTWVYGFLQRYLPD